MRWASRRDGAVAVYDDADTTDDMLVVEPVITAFTPVSGNGRCTCGVQFSLRQMIEGAEISCHRCHRAHGFISVGIRVHR